MLDQTLALPEDPEELRSFTARLLAEVKAQAILIEKLRHQLAGHRAHRFGASSETAEQLQLALESSEIAAAAMTARMRLPDIEEKDKPKRRPIPDHIPRMEVELGPGAEACADCGGRLRRIGEDVTEELEYVPSRFIVNRIVRPRLTWTCCERFVQAPLPSRPIERGRPGPGLLAHVLVSKYADHLPLYRQSQIFDREGLDLDRSTLADWVGKSTALLEPLADAIGRHVLSAEAIFADDTPVSMLAPGTGKTRTARLWTYARDERPWGGSAPPAAWYRFSGDRKGQHPKDHLARYRGWMHADGYAGFEDLYRSGAIREVACMAHVRRKFVDIHRSQGSPIAQEAITRIARLYAVEKEARGAPPDRRAELRQAHAAPVFDELEAWLAMQLTTISGKSPLAAAIRYALTRMQRLRPYLDHGILELDNNAAERGMRAVALGRKNYLFVGSEAGEKAAAIAYTLIGTAKLNAVDPLAWLADTLARIPDCAGPIENLEPGITIGMHPAVEAGEVVLRVLTLAVAGEAIPGGRGRRAGPGPLVTGIGPEPGGPGLASARRQHLHRRVVGEDRLGREDMAADRIGQRLQQGGGLADPVGQGRAVEVEAVTLEDPALAVERQMIGIFVHQHMGEETRTRPTALDGAGRQRGLDEALAARTGQPRPHDPVHDEAARDVFQLLGDILADPAQAPAAIGTGVGTWRQFHFHPGEVIRDRATLRFILLIDVWQLHPRRHRGGGDLAGLEGEVELFCRLR